MAKNRSKKPTKKVLKPVVPKLLKTEPQDFEEFISYSMRRLHNALLMGGTSQMESALYMLLPHYEQWIASYRVTYKQKD